MLKLSRMALPVIFVLLLGNPGCVQRTLTVRTDPPGALVYMNDQEIGRSPVTRYFLWYGFYDIEVRLPGYQSIKTVAPVIAPWWQIVPIDLIAEMFPVTDHHELFYTLHPPIEQDVDPKLLVRRGEELQKELRSSRLPPTTSPVKHHVATRKSETRMSKPETNPSIK
jgi:hypothetical protein